MNRGRFGIVVVLVVALLASAAARQLGERQRHATQIMGQSSASSTGSSLSGMNSFALALLLGGLRGPLVMILWSNSETQKMEKNLEGLDTQIEWIRLLQPEFDTVHIFQIWNKAYNVSVQMASLANKYLTILDALEYAHNIDHDRPDNINTMVAIGQVYGDKLGQSTEKTYYREQVRKQTLPHAMKQKLSRNDPGWRRLELDPMLDDKGNILPSLVAPRGQKLSDNEDTYDGSELQYLARYAPFHDGIDPSALGYNYFKRAQALQTLSKQKHAQLSDSVIDSRPALSLKQWSEAEAEASRRMEFAAMGLVAPKEIADLELPTASLVKLDTVAKNPAELQHAIANYRLTAKLCKDAVAEYERHIRKYRDSLSTYQSHIDAIKPMGELATADADYLQATISTGEQRDQLIKSARANYEAAMDGFTIVVLKYYVDPELVTKARLFNYDPRQIEFTTPAQRAEMLQRIQSVLTQVQGRRDDNLEDRQEYERFISRSKARLNNLPAAPSSTRPSV